ncbi:hypothetical protein E2C01_084832 [Portunus trituberculatus]|uniref:Uncharacterized protein n=1 Tax=Portunus trituberculatus TaxID=210409 RepID=A0A5B7IZB5_PORTR|nr:hypothetical protein [Portunus trituberculatus]
MPSALPQRAVAGGGAGGSRSLQAVPIIVKKRRQQRVVVTRGRPSYQEPVGMTLCGTQEDEVKRAATAMGSNDLSTRTCFK